MRAPCDRRQPRLLQHQSKLCAATVRGADQTSQRAGSFNPPYGGETFCCHSPASGIFLRTSLAIVAVVAAFTLAGCFEGAQGPAGPQGDAGPQGPQGAKGRLGRSVLQVPPGASGTSGLHALRQPGCGQASNCDLTCSPGEKLISVTCPGGTIAISKNPDIEAATCSSATGPALALCMKP